MKRLSLRGVAMLAAALALAPTARAGFIVDQSQLSETSPMAAFIETDLAQSFQQTNANITGAAIKLRAGYGNGLPGDITIQLYSALPNAGGTLLASGTALGITAGNFATVNFGLVPITPDTTYYLVFTSTNQSLAISGDTSNPYSRGQVYANAGYGSFSTYDYTFQTFASDSASAVPAPPGFILAGLGCLGMFGGLRLRRRFALAM